MNWLNAALLILIVVGLVAIIKQRLPMGIISESVRWRQLHRGAGWLLIAIVGAILIGHLPSLGVNEYTARWLGALFKIASSVFGGYRVSRDVLRIDPSAFQHDGSAYALLHLSRAIIIGALAVAVCVAV